MVKNLLEMKDVKVAYGDHTVLENFTMSIDQGEFVGIIGPNGTGKSTLIKVITKILEAKEGYVFLNGRNNSTLTRRERAKLVSVVPQEFTVDFDFNAYDIVMMGRNPHQYGKEKNLARDHDIVNEAMVMTNTWQFKDRLFNELSGGERQRIIIARAIAQQADLILLDEPTSHLDVHHQLEVLELVKRLNRERNTTIVAVLHDINMAARFSDRLILLSNKNVLADGPPDYVVDEKYLGKVYAMEMVVRNNNLLSTREVIPIRVIKDRLDNTNIQVHVISGGGSGEQILERLKSLGVHLSCGVINQGDSDWEMCKMMNISMAEGPPFSDITEEGYKKNIELIRQADYVLVTDLPFGTGNVKNLEVLLEANSPIYMIRREGRFDYTEGKATELLHQIQEEKIFHWIDGYDEFIDLACKGDAL
ncbi:ABC transporter ATP-binding protein [Alkalibacter rhizosphaerae]|uniref:ABC transporter ATP-binding protein n=1 Tax=Alkalibacter rhizosphaerae TaxID=2815577 RepID=A0A974XET4_9FIRM|nr:ABC transporter ATP-binding protein [Alkalibacter rhizosphaerae]QSX08376.1 ABC transporter ATP-binding protein [Alkalibacter rhizosphaerae]